MKPKPILTAFVLLAAYRCFADGLDGEPETMILFVDGKRVCSSTIKPYVVRGTAWATGQTTLTPADSWITPQSAVIIR